MLRRSSLLSVVAASLLAATLPSSAAPTPLPAEMPRPNCTARFIDKEGDAKDAAGQVVPGRDLTGVLLRVTDDQLQVFLAMKDVVDPNAMPLTEGAYKYDVKFKLGDAQVNFGLAEYSSQALWTVGSPPNSTTTPTNGYPKAYIGTGTAPASDDFKLAGYTADYYSAADYVIFTAPRKRVEEILGVPLKDGDLVTSMTVTTTGMVQAVQPTSATVDTLDVPAAPAKNEWAVGNDYPCFVGEPATLTNLVIPPVAYGDSVTLSAKLVDAKGAVAVGKTLKFTVAGDAGTPLTADTGADGVAKVSYTPRVGAGKYPVTVSYKGDPDVGKATTTGSITVGLETTVFSALAVTKPSSTTRTVTVTLSDNDKHVLAGQKVDWYVNGKKVATVVTDSKGRSVFKKAKPTQTVQAKYAGLAAKYKPVASKAVKV